MKQFTVTTEQEFLDFVGGDLFERYTTKSYKDVKLELRTDDSWKNEIQTYLKPNKYIFCANKSTGRGQTFIPGECKVIFKPSRGYYDYLHFNYLYSDDYHEEVDLADGGFLVTVYDSEEEFKTSGAYLAKSIREKIINSDLKEELEEEDPDNAIEIIYTKLSELFGEENIMFSSSETVATINLEETNIVSIAICFYHRILINFAYQNCEEECLDDSLSELIYNSLISSF